MPQVLAAQRDETDCYTVVHVVETASLSYCSPCCCLRDIICRFADIGFPSGVGSREVGSQAALDSWLAAAARRFPSATQPVKAPYAMDREMYAEPGNAICTMVHFSMSVACQSRRRHMAQHTCLHELSRGALL